MKQENIELRKRVTLIHSHMHSPLDKCISNFSVCAPNYFSNCHHHYTGRSVSCRAE